MYKLIAAVAVFVFCVFAGRYFSDKKSKKAAFYLSLCNFNGNYIKEMNFSRRPLKELLSKSYPSANFNDLLALVKQRVFNESLSDLCGALAGRWQNGLNLSEGDITEIEEYFSMLGKSDALSQSEECYRYKNYFEHSLAESEKSDKSMGSLYNKLGIIVGLIAFVIVI
ncbi:MAG: stage III sporulation protein AB [Candidatus Borkfalkiaceae bacterium]|nr:stage III sporulation protein AB [Christensenellaceae bacterium]